MQHYFVDKFNDSFVLKETDYHHIKNVMRMKNNDQIICINEGEQFLCSLLFFEKDYQIKVIEKIQKKHELNKEIILYQSLIKNDKFDFVIQKATELGVNRIYPTITERSIIKIDKDKYESKVNRYQKIAKEASEQSCREHIPTINNFIQLKDIIIDDDTLALLAYENNKNPHSLAELLKNLDEYKKIAIIVGPEGGFSDNEVKILMRKKFHNVSLGKRILRSETATLCLLSVLSFKIEGEVNG